ncbi:MAG: SUMF1/EgtB/PvdO family nonheme iron enzyme [Bacteroidia bacterium]
MTSYTTLLLLIFLPLAGMAPSPAEKNAPLRAGKDFALFFAVDTYDDPGWKDLKNPGRDADALAAELRDVFGFQVMVYKNKTRREIYQILEQWKNKSYPGDGQLMVFFSGHGDFNPTLTKGFFVTREGKYDDPYNDSHLDLTTIGNIITTIPCQHILLAIDACYSGTIDREIAFNDRAKPTTISDGPTSEADRQALIALQLRNKSRLLLTSGGKERTPDGTDHSPFTNGFLRALRRSYTYDDNLLTWLELRAEMQKVIPTPHEGTLPGDASGGFVFVAQAIAKPEQKATPTVITPPETGVVKTSPITDQIPGPKMVKITGGTFKRGNYNVTVSDFWLGKTEVTNGQYAEFLNAKGNQSEGGVEWYDASGKGYLGYAEAAIQKQGNSWVVKSGREDHPVNYVSWYGAKAYCDWLSKQTGQQWRLPTEAEWEYAAGGGSSGRTIYAGTDSESTLGDYAWFTTNTKDTGTRPVGQKKPNRLGLYDMSGNVWEWCGDWYGDYPSSDISNPTGPTSGSHRVNRGGSWHLVAPNCRVAYRYSLTPGLRSSLLGFRPTRTH